MLFLYVGAWDLFDGIQTKCIPFLGKSMLPLLSRSGSVRRATSF
jgi:hypothetical protein